MAMLTTTAMAVPLRSLPKLDVDLRGEVSVKKIAPQVHCHPREIGFTCLAPLLPQHSHGIVYSRTTAVVWLLGYTLGIQSAAPDRGPF